SGGGRPAAAGFTLIELLVATALIVIALGITFSTFYSISKAWQRGQAIADSLNRGEFVMEQITCGLRSAFYPVRQPSSAESAATTNTQAADTNATVTGAQASVSSPTDYGFVLEDNGEGIEGRDAISWVKTGSALLGTEDSLWRGLHRVKISVEENDDSLAIVSRAWRPYGNDINFTPDEVPPFVISERVLGMNCRVAKEADDEEGWEWEDEWGTDATNRLPLAVEIVLYLAPPEESGEPVEIKRVVEIPAAPLSWSAGKNISHK
ncbi:MAG: prepilin-type N-terminal cleavage/methylation domain-containing protein, partial [Kiritimatiellia bacterium]|nr:prepilin-type N-terminal cleavage/methylation domain-containing protein [Kiritimatiellia bacterium]